MQPSIVLGIDAAWGPNQPSGVALVRGHGSEWSCLCVAPSYDDFIARANGIPVNWILKAPASTPDTDRLLHAATKLAGARPTIVSVDMPMSRELIQARRAADNMVSSAYASRLCGTHSPSALRPGKISDDMRSALERQGYPLATNPAELGSTPRVIEVYPHPAIVELMNLEVRHRYKISKSTKFWPGETREARTRNLLDQFESLYRALSDRLGALPFRLPRASGVPTLDFLKRYEDALDALVCCWVGVEFLGCRAQALGDASAAIWCPTNTVKTCHPKIVGGVFPSRSGARAP